MLCGGHSSQYFSGRGKLTKEVGSAWALVFSWWPRRGSGLIGEFLGKGLMGWRGPQVFRVTNMCLRTGKN